MIMIMIINSFQSERFSAVSTALSVSVQQSVHMQNATRELLHGFLKIFWKGS